MTKCKLEDAAKNVFDAIPDKLKKQCSRPAKGVAHSWRRIFFFTELHNSRPLPRRKHGFSQQAARGRNLVHEALLGQPLQHRCRRFDTHLPLVLARALNLDSGFASVARRGPALGVAGKRPGVAPHSHSVVVGTNSQAHPPKAPRRSEK
jgi:hypothetical protein